ncbi:hypothetical protein MUK42_30250 [Musa troglodytarum]|uniref:Uncharacterized protein n=1 Tax=Musa troglodytarum TaxID=320322 RepID=A0A9E7FIS6_9LILI|nr:hypothetical protein MUK42_30250 [Musa troglodytarum]
MKPRQSGVRQFGQTSLPLSFFSKSGCCSSPFSDLSYFDCFFAVVFLSDLEDFCVISSLQTHISRVPDEHHLKRSSDKQPVPLSEFLNRKLIKTTDRSVEVKQTSFSSIGSATKDSSSKNDEASGRFILHDVIFRQFMVSAKGKEQSEITGGGESKESQLESYTGGGDNSRKRKNPFDSSEDGFVKPSLAEEGAMNAEARKQLKDRKKKEKKALFTIYQGLDDIMFEIIALANTSKEIPEEKRTKLEDKGYHPLTFEEACNEEKWQQAMNEEIRMSCSSHRAIFKMNLFCKAASVTYTSFPGAGERVRARKSVIVLGDDPKPWRSRRGETTMQLEVVGGIAARKEWTVKKLAAMISGKEWVPPRWEVWNGTDSTLIFI